MTRGKNYSTIACAVIAFTAQALAQISPGELSRAHSKFEGAEHCLQCHDEGRVITGKKCLSCHGEIQHQFDEKYGFHYTTAGTQCVTCHKEHIGRDSRTYRFDPASFNHSETGYALEGKHKPLKCTSCHRPAFVKRASVAATALAKKRFTYLGLTQACIDCHKDYHKGSAGTHCATCHTTAGFSVIRGFNHDSTRFPLTGRHTTLACGACHSQKLRKAGGELKFSVASFADCSACHRSPHGTRLSSEQCSSCHQTEGWNTLRIAFDHTLTRFTLADAHVKLECSSCHRNPREKITFDERYKLRFERCSSCHADIHAGTLASDCSSCHTNSAFRPSLYTAERHAKTRFALEGAHRALACVVCHPMQKNGTLPFRTKGVLCGDCHADPHRGQFISVMKSRSCAACHSPSTWKLRSFDHSTTSFKLEGKHADTPCNKCHAPAVPGDAATAVYRGTARLCSSCHQTPHGTQFDAEGPAACERCHTPFEWKNVLFDHQTQSRFQLTGAHLRVPCGSCHTAEEQGGKQIIIYKPKATTCESCHKRANGV